MSEVLVKVENVSKKFCRDLKKSLWYGIKDMGSALFSNQANHSTLRPSEFWAVKDVSFELRRGECLGLTGHNGAGKSTLLKIISGLIRPDEGLITMHGRIGALIELGAGFNPILTGRENIYNNGAVLGFSKKEIDAKYNKIVEFSEIGDFIDTPVQNYSSGMKVRLGFAVAAQMEPDILLIDEVLAVGDIGFRIKCLNRISDLLKSCAVIFVTHSMPQIARICTQGIQMKNGLITLQTYNIGLLIEKYFLSFDNHQNGELLSDAEIEFNNLKIQNEPIKKEYVYSIDSDTNICLEFTISIPKSYKFFSIHTPIVDMQMNNVAITTSLTNIEKIPNNKNQFHIKTEIPNLFSAGKYYLGISLIELVEINGNTIIGNTFLKYNNCCCFVVTNTALTVSSPILIKSKWEIYYE